MDWTEKDVKTWKRSDAGGIYYVKVPGQAGWKSSGKTKKAQAIDWAMIQATGGHQVDVTLGVYAKDFFVPGLCPIVKLREAAGGRATLKHWDDQRGALVNHVLPKWGKTMLAALEPRTVFAWLSSPDLVVAKPSAESGKAWRKVPLSGAHRNRLLIVLNAIMTHAVFDRLISSNPLTAVPRMRLNTPPRGTFTEGELEKMFPVDEDALKRIWGSLRWAALFMVLADSGLRPSEALALRWRDWHPSAYAFVVALRIGGDGQPGPLKTAKKGVAKKVALIRGRTAELIDDLWEDLQPEPDGLLFPASRYGRSDRQPMRVSAAGGHFVDALPKADIVPGDRTLYCLRHTETTRSVTEFGPEVTRGRMGWTLQSRMVETYDHPDDADLVARELNRLGRA